WLVLSRGGEAVAGWVRLLTLGACGLVVVGWVRHWFGVAGRRRAAGYGLLTLGLYVAANAVASQPGKAHAREAAQRRFGPGEPAARQPAAALAVAAFPAEPPLDLHPAEVEPPLGEPAVEAVAAVGHDTPLDAMTLLGRHSPIWARCSGRASGGRAARR